MPPSHTLRFSKIVSRATRTFTRPAARHLSTAVPALDSAVLQSTSVSAQQLNPNYVDSPVASLDDNTWSDDSSSLETWPTFELNPKASFSPEDPPHSEVFDMEFNPKNGVVGNIYVSSGPFGEDLEPPSEQRPIATLGHGLDRVLFNPGIHWLRDPRSRVYNFPPWLQWIPKLSTFDFDRVNGFVQSSRDSDLLTAALREDCHFAGSTSSLTGMLAQIYFLLSRFHPVTLSNLSKAFEHASTAFTFGQRLPSAVILNYKDGIYLTDSDPGDPGEMGSNVLSFMGTMLEKFLTEPKTQFQTYLHETPPQPETDTRREAYRYAKFGQFVMRSQLDCHDSRLPGTGVFDLKTRAAIPLRVDPMNVEEGSGYLLRGLHGRYESFESEYYDLIKSAFLKYSLQARIGNMDGVMVTYHNTSQLFGFQYIPLEEMDEALYGNKRIGPMVFQACVSMLEAITTEVVKCFPEQSVACLWKTSPEGTLHVFVEPVQGKSERSRPIAQLDITVRNFVDSGYIRDGVISQLDPLKDWDIKYHICKVRASYQKIRARRDQFLEAKRRFWAIPTGMSVAEMEAFWKGGLGIGQVPNADFDPNRFTQPSGFVQALRSMSRDGARDTERQQEEDRKKRRVVWRQMDGDDIEDWEQDVIDEGLDMEPDTPPTTSDSPLPASVLPAPLQLMNNIGESQQHPIRELYFSSLSSSPQFTPVKYRKKDAEQHSTPFYPIDDRDYGLEFGADLAQLATKAVEELELPPAHEAILRPKVLQRIAYFPSPYTRKLPSVGSVSSRRRKRKQQQLRITKDLKEDVPIIPLSDLTGTQSSRSATLVSSPGNSVEIHAPVS